jgi:hypothetical protein
LSYGNSLAYAFRQLYKTFQITGCQQEELAAWIKRNFHYLSGYITKEYTTKYLEITISTDNHRCKNPIMEVHKDNSTGIYFIIKA